MASEKAGNRRLGMSQKRQHQRIEFEAEVELEIDGKTQPGQTINISQGGIYVETQPTPDFGTKLSLFIDLPGIRETCKIPSIVRWVKDDGGIGLQFEQLRAIEMWGINKLLSALTKE